MMLIDKKKALMTIMKKRSEKGEVSMAPMKQESVKDEEGEVDGRLAAAQDAMSAMHEKSAAKFMDAMANFHDLHMMHKDAGTGEPEEA